MFQRIIFAVLVAGFVTPRLSHAAGLDACSKAIAVATEGYVAAKQKAIKACEDNKSKGKLAADVNCRPADGAVTDAKTDKKLTAAAAKVNAKIAAKCTTLPPLGPACDSALTAAALADCITATAQDADVEPINVDTIIATEYNTTPPIADKGLQKCQATIAKEGGAYMATRMKLQRSCETKRAGGKVTACPDAAAGKALAKARDKFAANIKKKCNSAQVAALDFGGACALYDFLTFERVPGSSNNSVLPIDQLVGCMADAHAGVADRMAAIGLPGRELSDFPAGVAAGDATSTSAVFWTRLPNPSQPGNLEITTDPKFKTVQMTVPVSTLSGAPTAKVDVPGLSAATAYFYRFTQGGATSATGRVVTAPAANDTSRTVRLGWTGDSNAYNQPFTSLNPMRLLSPDAWLYIGDTIYGDDPLADGVVAETLAEYHGKYEANRADHALRTLMASTGTYVMWDDHEVRNDFAGAVPAYASRMAAGNQAFRQYFPIRDDSTDAMRLYRNFQWGSGAEFFLIDDRQYRSAKYTCCTNAANSGFVTTDGDGNAGDSTCGGTAGEALVPSASCASAMAGASRTILGAAQKQWLKDGLMNSTATFKFIMNGPAITELVFVPYDRWEAWKAERTEILDFIQNNNIKNVIWLSTDLHAYILSGSQVDATHHVPEIISGSIGENTIFRELPPSVAGLLPQLPALLPQIDQYDIDRYNTVLITVTPGAAATAQFDTYDRTGAKIHSVSYPAS
jgi:alkaline phosphatase D